MSTIPRIVKIIENLYGAVVFFATIGLLNLPMGEGLVIFVGLGAVAISVAFATGYLSYVLRGNSPEDKEVFTTVTATEIALVVTLAPTFIIPWTGAVLVNLLVANKQGRLVGLTGNK